MHKLSCLSIVELSVCNKNPRKKYKESIAAFEHDEGYQLRKRELKYYAKLDTFSWQNLSLSLRDVVVLHLNTKI